jgi:hypothetical protein
MVDTQYKMMLLTRLRNPNAHEIQPVERSEINREVLNYQQVLTLEQSQAYLREFILLCISHHNNEYRRDMYI